MKPSVKYGIIAVLWIFLLIFAMFGDKETNVSQNDVVSTTISSTQETTILTEQLVIYYDRDETVNLYLNRFNAANPNQLIDSDLFEVYYHHGKEHEDQIIFNRDNVEVVITGNYLNNSIELVIDGDDTKTTDDYRLLFYQYAKAYSSNLTDDKLETYWNDILNDSINSAEFDEFDCSLNVYNNAIEYMIIDGIIQ